MPKADEYEVWTESELRALEQSRGFLAVNHQEIVDDINATARGHFTTPDRFPFTMEPAKLVDGKVLIYARFLAVIREAHRRGKLEGKI